MAGGPLTIRPEGDGHDVRRMFADQPVGRARALSGSVIHVLAALVLLVVVRFLPDKAFEAVLPDRLPEDIVWLAEPGPGGGGGGGNQRPEPPKPPELKAPEPVNVKPPEPTPLPVPDVPIFEPSILPLETLATDVSNVGAIAPPSLSDSRGTGRGTGSGPGNGPGLGPGEGGGVGDGVYQPGNGVLSPVPIKQVKPAYTADAMRARAQGTVGLNCVVHIDGSVRSCNVVQAVRPDFGLNDEAIKAAQQWRFRPGTRMGEPVNVLVRIELDFNLR